jgi:hypothetical protein
MQKQQEQQGILWIGASKEPTKTIPIHPVFQNGIYTINKDNWLQFEDHKDCFEVTIQDDICTCRRTDHSEDSGWGTFLMVQIPLRYGRPTDIFPVFHVIFPESKAIKQSNESFQHLFHTVHTIQREHRWGAHISAHLEAINKGYEFYAVVENNATPLFHPDKMKHYIDKCLLENPSVVLFDIGVEVPSSSSSRHLFPLKQGGEYPGAYLCHRSFGEKLVVHCIQHPDTKFFDSWRTAFPNETLFHKPRLFHQ